MDIKKIIAVGLLLYAVFGSGLLDLLDRPMPEPQPKPPEKILNIDTPSETVIARVSLFSDLVTDPTDRAKLAIFNYEFAKRIEGYSTTSQQVNDVYALAGKTFFKGSLVDKYDGLAEEIVKLLQEIMGEENHALTLVEKQELSEYFKGVSWVLIQPRNP